MSEANKFQVPKRARIRWLAAWAKAAMWGLASHGLKSRWLGVGVFLCAVVGCGFLAGWAALAGGPLLFKMPGWALALLFLAAVAGVVFGPGWVLRSGAKAAGSLGTKAAAAASSGAMELDARAKELAALRERGELASAVAEPAADSASRSEVRL